MSMNAFAHALRQRLPAMEKLLLVLLGDRADPWGGSIFFAMATLVDHAGMSLSTLRRTFRELVKRGHIVLEVPATPKTPPFYRMVGVPEPLNPEPWDDGCPQALRRAVQHYFDARCSWCQTPGTVDAGGDGKPWTVTRIDPTKYVGRFTPDNVTRSCAFCARKRTREMPRDVAVLTLAEMVKIKGCQVDTPSLSDEGCQVDTSVSPGHAIQPDTPQVSTGHPPGVNLTPDPILDPRSDPTQKEQGLTPRATCGRVPDADQNVAVITVIAHEVIDQLGATHDDLAETVKGLCATRGIAYHSLVVNKALDSARWQRTHRSPEAGA